MAEAQKTIAAIEEEEGLLIQQEISARARSSLARLQGRMYDEFGRWPGYLDPRPGD